MWDRLRIKRLDAREYLKEIAYKDQIPLFKKIAGEIGVEQGWTVEEIRKRFSNELLIKCYLSRGLNLAGDQSGKSILDS